MFNRILVALMLSTLVMAPAQAVDDPFDNEVQAAPRVAPRPYTADLWDGAKNVGSGTKNIGLGVVNTLYIAKKIGETGFNLAGAVGHAPRAILNIVYADPETKDKHMAKLTGYASGTVRSAGKVLKNISEPFKNFKDGAVELGSGITTIAKTTYAACKDAVESETGQKAKAAVVAGASYVGSKLSSVYNWFTSKVVGVVGNALNYDKVSDAVSFE